LPIPPPSPPSTSSSIGCAKTFDQFSQKEVYADSRASDQRCNPTPSTDYNANAALFSRNSLTYDKGSFANNNAVVLNKDVIQDAKLPTEIPVKPADPPAQSNNPPTSFPEPQSTFPDPNKTYDPVELSLTQPPIVPHAQPQASHHGNAACQQALNELLRGQATVPRAMQLQDWINANCR